MTVKQRGLIQSILQMCPAILRVKVNTLLFELIEETERDYRERLGQ